MPRRHLVPAFAAVTLLVGASTALALDTTARVTFIDRDAGIVRLDNGDAVTAPADFDLATLEVAMLVEVTYDETSGEGPYPATAMTIIPPPPPGPPVEPPADAAPADDGAAADGDGAAADIPADEGGEDDDGM